MSMRAIHLWALAVFLAHVANGSANYNSIQWINPSPGTSLMPGQSVEAKWTSNQPIKDPSFSLCTADARCGQATPAKIVDNPDGTTSALLSLPNVDGGGGMFLQMNDQDGGAIHQSPTFRVDSASSPKAMAEHSGDISERVPSPAPAPRKSDEEEQTMSAEAGAEGGSEGQSQSPGDESSADGAETSHNPYKWDDEEPSPTSAGGGPTATGVAEAVSSFAKEASLTGEYPLPTSFDPSAIPTAFPSQWPFSNPYAALNMTSSVTSSSASASSTSSAAGNAAADDGRPNAAIIAVPLGICGAIMLASLLFCARSRMKKQKDLESGCSGPSDHAAPGDWQAIIKRKALDASVEKGPEGVNSVTITERRDDAVVPTLGYSQPTPRQLPPPAAAQRRYPEPKRYQLQDRYVDDQYTRFEGMYGRADSYDRREGEYARREGWRERLREDTLDGYGYRRGSADRSAISSRSGSGTRCLTPMRSRGYDSRDGHVYRYDYEYPARRYDDRYARQSHSSHGSRGSRDKWDDYDRHYNYGQSNHPRHRKDEYYSPSRRSRSGLGGIPSDDRCGCSSCLPTPPVHRHASGCVDCRRQESTSTRPRTPPRQLYDDSDLPGPTYSRSAPGPPEPMIRTRTSSSSSRSYRRRHDSEPEEKGHSSRRAEGLRRADTSMSTASERGWDLAGKGAYDTAHGRTMGELYESLRRAIGESEGGMERMRSR